MNNKQEAIRITRIGAVQTTAAADPLRRILLSLHG